MYEVIKWISYQMRQFLLTFQSKNEYLIGKIDIQLKLVPGNSVGIVTAYYISSLVVCLNGMDLDLNLDLDLRGPKFKSFVWVS